MGQTFLYHCNKILFMYVVTSCLKCTQRKTTHCIFTCIQKLVFMFYVLPPHQPNQETSESFATSSTYAEPCLLIRLALLCFATNAWISMSFLSMPSSFVATDVVVAFFTFLPDLAGWEWGFPYNNKPDFLIVKTKRCNNWTTVYSCPWCTKRFSNTLPYA